MNKAVIVIPWSPWHPAGVSVVVRNIMAESEAIGVKAILCQDNWEFRSGGRDVEGVLCLRFGLLGGVGFIPFLKSLISAPIQLIIVARWLRQNDVSAVNFHYVGLGGLSVALLKFLRVFRGRFVLSFHGTDLKLPESIAGRYLYRFMVRNADTITFCSHSLANRARLLFGQDVDRFEIIYNGVDVNVFRPGIKKSSDLPEKYLVQVGSFDIRKRQFFLLDAFSRIASLYHDLSLVLIGMDGPERMRIEKFAEELGLADRVVIRTNLDSSSVARIVSNAFFCVQPSSAEPFGIAVIEAGACGVPVIASRVDGHLETIEEGVDGLLFTVDNVDACVKAMRRFLDDDRFRESLGSSFYNKIVRDFRWSQCAHRYFELLNELRE